MTQQQQARTPTPPQPHHTGTNDPAAGPQELLARLHRVRQDAQDVAAQDQGIMSSLGAEQLEELIGQADQASRALISVRSAAYRALEAGKTWQSKGDASLGAYAGRITATGPAGGTQQVAWARTLGHLPVLDDQLRSGAISPEHVAVVTRAIGKGNTDTRLAAFQTPAGQRVLAMGKGLTAARFAPYVEQFAMRADTSGADTHHEQVHARRFLRVFTKGDGIGGEFFLDQVAGTLLREALTAARHRPGRDDQRTSTQRDADALTDIARLALNSGKLKARAAVRPHAIVLVHSQREHQASPAPAPPRPDTVSVAPDDRHSDATSTAEPVETRPAAAGPDQAGAADRAGQVRVGHCATGMGPDADPVTWTDGTPIAPTAAARLLCDAEWTRVVVSPVSQVLDLGQSVRLFERELRKAIIARDQTCRWKGCHRPAVWGELHHIVYFEDGGDTSVDNGILLCTYHHHEVHRRDLSIIFTLHGVSILTRTGEQLSYTDHPETLRQRARASPAA